MKKSTILLNVENALSKKGKTKKDLALIFKTEEKQIDKLLNGSVPLEVMMATSEFIGCDMFDLLKN